MTISELIEALKSLPPDSTVTRYSTEIEGVDWYNIEHVYVDDNYVRLE